MADDVSRREVLRRAILSSALLLGAKRSLQAAPETAPVLQPPSRSPGAPEHGLLQALPPGAVRPQGWQRTMLEQQAAQLGAKLPEVSWPFTQAFWEGRRVETPPGMVPADRSE